MSDPVKLNCQPSYTNVRRIQVERYEDGHISIWLWGDRIDENSLSRSLEVVHIHSGNSDSKLIDLNVEDKYKPAPDRPAHVPANYSWDFKEKRWVSPIIYLSQEAPQEEPTDTETA
jgi:hypothetical protein